tara:strand:+ start:1117 stop:1878 length:762 start_codon:yes stop_codon:yes gene_type:complete
MTWPTSSKASNQNVDQPSDKIADARTDILQNIQNTNTIIDKFTISSPNNNDILVGDASNKLVNSDPNVARPYFAYVRCRATTANIQDIYGDSSSIPRIYFSPMGLFDDVKKGIYDPDDILEVSGGESRNDSVGIDTIYIKKPGTYTFFVQQHLGVSLSATNPPAAHHLLGDFGIEVGLEDGTVHSATIDDQNTDHDVGNVGYAVMIKPIILSDITVATQATVRFFMTNPFSSHQKLINRSTGNEWLLKIHKTG